MLEHNYVLGHSAGEVRRLELQAGLFAPGTERMLRTAGLGPGLSVLDIGTGAGDVALLSANLVGPSGSVLGIDREASVLERARARAGGARHVVFREATLDALPPREMFDLVVGRYVLSYQPDRAAYLRQAARFVRPGGTLLFIEPALPEPDTPDADIGEPWSCPAVPLFEEMLRLILVAFRLGGARLGTGARLVPLFLEAGLPEPAMLREVPIGGPGSAIVEWLCLTLRTLMPVLEKRGVTSAARFGLDTLEPRLQVAVSEARSQLRGADLTGGWARIG